MIIHSLKWDSAFFNLRIAAAALSVTDNKQGIMLDIASYKNDYDLIYVYTPENYFLPENILDNEKIRLVDSKVVYSGMIPNATMKMDNRLSIYLEKEIRPELFSLALQSGAYSRYKSDPNFKPGDFERLYTKWIESSIDGSIADVVFVYEENNKITGMVTAALDTMADSVKIGLIAVDNAAQNRGIGTILMNGAKNYALRQSVRYIEVATQVRNKQACAFYEKCNLSVKSVTNIYHFWLQ